MSSENSICPICSQPTFLVYGKYPRKDGLCKECSQKLFNNEIEQCDQCGKWNKVGETCTCKKPKHKTIVKETQQEETSELTCIICGEVSNGKHFCISCYHEYKNRSIDIRLKNLKFETILDDYGNLKYKCEDGRYVRSLQEQSIANTLWNLDIKYIYEEKVYYYSQEENAKSISPDFYLPKHNLYIEHIGFTSKKHDSTTKYKQKIYDEQGKNVIFTSPENLQDFKDFIKKKLHLN